MYSEKKIKKVCFITPGHISTNPRLVKEAITLLKNGFSVHIIFTQYVKKLIIEDYYFLNSNPTIRYNALDWTDRNIKSYLTKLASGFINKISQRIHSKFNLSALQILAINRNYYWQLKKAISLNADIYIAHNLGALPIAILAAKKKNKKSGFDAEDFHRYEETDDKTDLKVKLKVSIEETYMPQADYVSAASPLIADYYQKNLGINVTCILNVFPKRQLTPNCKNDIPLKLFWFSQTVGPERGIETIIDALCILKDYDIELNLLGEVNPVYEDKLKNILGKSSEDTKRIKFYKMISPDLIFDFGQAFDIGMCSETGFSTNNNIALSNKIFTYMQCSLAIVASDTLAQKCLLEEHPHLGFLYKKNDAESLANVLSNFINNRDELVNAKNWSYRYAQQKFNWENEEEKFLNVIRSL
ncbi:glycosyltransferase [Pedobacter lithocola]|uniref:Glycosyltransferase n=1 Tax=Pedobacter lithocola TaxID=1908239 RepID=A0ABV8P7N2_9SPHI